MGQFKTRFISDNVHGNIPFSSLIENNILGNPLFNRLQSIKQNSTAFKTYPSLEHSRFIHSIGCMHLSSYMFHKSLINSETSDAISFLDIFNEYILAELTTISSYLKSETFINGIYNSINTSHEDEAVEQFNRQFNELKIDLNSLKIFDEYFTNDKIFSLYNPGKQFSDNQYFIYCCLLKALRLSALLHDLGHPPFSHAAEFAIIEFYKNNIENSSNYAEHPFSKTINFYINYLVNEIKLPEGKNLHESITVVFIDYIFDNLLFTHWKNKMPIGEFKETFIYSLYLSLTKILTLSICLGYPLHKNNTPDMKVIYTDKPSEVTPLLQQAFQALKTIISSEVDCDRLDYVIRDSRNSGFSTSTFNLFRVLDNFSLIKNQDSFHIIPSIRSLSDLEKFFRERLGIYRYIIFHHNVVKTDLVLYKIINFILKLLITDSSSNKNELQNIWKDFWELISCDDNRDFNTIQKTKFILRSSAWNEDWLMSAMLSSYRLFYNKVTSPSSRIELSINENKIYVLLKEFLYNKRNLLSLWKRNHSFIQFVELFSKHIYNNKSIIKDRYLHLTGQQSKTKRELVERSKITIIYNILEDSVFLNSGLDPDVTLKTEFKLVKLLLEYLFFLDKNVEEKLEAVLEQRIKSIVNNDVVVFIKIFADRLGAGVDNKFKLSCYKEHDISSISTEELGKVSSVLNELELTALYAPQLHMFIAKKERYDLGKLSSLTIDDINKITQILCTTIFEQFSELIKK